MGHGQHVTASQELSHRAETRKLLLYHLMEQASGEPQRGDLVLLQRYAQLLQRRCMGWEDHQSRPIEQTPPDLKR